jgi:hypothetical protein
MQEYHLQERRSGMMKSLVVRNLLLLVLILIASGASSTSWKEPQGVGVSRWGMSMAELRAYNSAMRCEAVLCKSDEWLRDDVHALAVWIFKDNKLIEVAFLFPAIQFWLVRGHYVTLYGQPHKHIFPIRTNFQGVEMLNETLTWEGLHVSITLEQYSSTDILARQAEVRIFLTPEGLVRYMGDKQQNQKGKKKQ